MKLRDKVLSCVILSLFATKIYTIDNAHFYKPPHLHSETTTSWSWFTNAKKYSVADWLTKLDISYAYGSTTKGWGHDGKSKNIMELVGHYDMLYLFENVVVQPDVQQYATFFKSVINHSRTNGDFGKLDFHGKFTINDFNINIKQNLISGLFLELLMPIRNVDLKNISFKDLSPETGVYNKHTYEWVQFKNNFDQVLENYDIHHHHKSFNVTAFGDISLLLGYQNVAQVAGKDSVKFDITLKSGVLFPTGKGVQTDYIYSIPTGYNKHWGIPVYGQVDMECCKWLTLSGHGSILFFFDKANQHHRMRTFEAQSGYLKLALGEAKEEKGILWHVGGDIKLDHLIKGFSFLAGYSYNQEEADTLHPNNHELFDYETVNDDWALDHWYQHVLHLMADYDFSYHYPKAKWGPRINIFMDYPFDGKNCYKTPMYGIGLGLDIKWKF